MSKKTHSADSIVEQTVSTRTLAVGIVENQLQHHSDREEQNFVAHHFGKRFLAAFASTRDRRRNERRPPRSDYVALMTRVADDRRGDGELESVVENDDLVLIERLLAFGTKRIRKIKREKSELRADAARVVASIAKEMAEVAVILAVEVDLLDLRVETLSLTRCTITYLPAVIQPNIAVNEAIHLRGVHLRDPPVLVVIIRFDEVRTTDDSASLAAHLPKIMLDENASKRGFLLYSEGSFFNVMFVDVRPILL